MRTQRLRRTRSYATQDGAVPVAEREGPDDAIGYGEKAMALRWLDSLSWGWIALVCATLGLAPFSPPHCEEEPT